MRRTIPRILSLVVAGALATSSILLGQARPPIPAHPRDLKYPVLSYTPPKPSTYRQTFSNGAVGFFVEDHDLPLVTVSVTIRTGSYLDPAGKEGLASAVGSQLRAGGTIKRKAEDFDEEADFLAANISSFVGDTSGSASVNFLAKDTDKALELFFEMLRTPAFAQDRLDLMKSQQLQQIERRNDRTDGIESREWNRLMRGDKHFSATFTTKASISSLTREDLVSFHRKYYQPAHMIFAVSGDFKTAELKARLEKWMEGWTGEKFEVPPPPKPGFTPVAGLYAVNKTDVNQARVSIGHLGIVRGNPDEFAIDMMNDILGGSGFTSRITNRVRSDEGLAYSAGSSFGSGVYYEGVFRAAFQTKSSTVAQAIQIVVDEIERIRKERVSAEELETVRNNAIEVFPRYFSSASAIAGTFAADEYTGRAPNYWASFRDKLRAVTLDDVQRVAQKYLHPDKLVILVVGNVDEVMKGNPDKPQYSMRKFSTNGEAVRIPLPDPNTMVYPK